MDKFNKILKEDAVYINKNVDLNELCGKKILITGASGLIGINFIMSLKEFSKNKKTVPIITAIFNSAIPNCFKEIVNFPNLKIEKGDITDDDFVNSLENADYIIHAAGYAQPGKFMQDKIKTIAINTTATMKLLKKLREGGKFLFISTSEVYSGLPNPPYKEDQIGTTTPAHPRACYIEGKRCGEAICHAYYEKGLAVKSARLSLAYGPGTKPHDMRVLNSFIEKGMKSKIEMMDQGMDKRTYCYVRDAVEIMWNILLFGKKPVYNVGGCSKTTIVALARKIAKSLKVEVIMPRDNRKVAGAPTNVCLNMSEVAKEFLKKKKDFVPLDEGLKSTIAWQKELYKLK